MYKKLESFIENNIDNWQDLLKKSPYNLKSVKKVPYIENAWMLAYNLFSTDFMCGDKDAVDIMKCCRGSIVVVEDGKAKVICAPFYKFFNIGEGPAEKLDFSNVEFQMKEDGSIIKAFKYKGVVYLTLNEGLHLNINIGRPLKNLQSTEEMTSKTFFDLVSKSLLQYPGFEIEHKSDVDCTIGVGEKWENLKEGETVMFEITSPENMIICRYDETQLYLIGFRDAGFQEHKACTKEGILPGKIVENIKADSLKDLKAMMDNWNGSFYEGVVACDGNFNRVKIKCQDYLSIKYLLGENEFCFKNILIAVHKKETDDLVSIFPESKALIENITKDYLFTLETTCILSENFKFLYKQADDRKEYADYVNKYLSGMSHLQNLAFSCIREDFKPVDWFKKNVDKIVSGSLVEDKWHKFYDDVNGFVEKQ